MYSLATALVVGATYCLVRVVARTSRRWVVLYALAMAAALYTHHYTWLAFGAHGPLLLAVAVRRRDRLILAAGALALVLYLPLLPVTVQQVTLARGMSWKPHLAVPQMLKDLASFITLCASGDRQVPLRTVLIGLLPAVAGLTVGWLHGKCPWALAALSAAVPVAAACMAQAFFPFYTARYVLFLVPFFCLLAALGGWAVARSLLSRRTFLGAALLAASLVLPAVPAVQALARYYQGGGPLKADFRVVAAHLERSTRPGDALALVGTAPPLLQYYTGDLPRQAFPDVNDADYVTDEREVAQKLSVVARPGACIWWVGSAWAQVDPENLVEAQLREHCDFWDEQWWQEKPIQTPIRVATYVVRNTAFGPLPRRSVGATFGPVKLVSYSIQRDSKGRLFVALWWDTLAPPGRDYNAFVHLIDPDGEIVAQGDHIPLNQFYPIRNWKPGQTWRDEHVLTPPPGVEMEKLRLRIGLSWGEGGEHQLQIVGGPWQGRTYVILPVQ